MQIIKLWLKISTLLALLGWAVHALDPGFAAWIDGLFAKDPVAITEATPEETNGPKIPEPIPPPAYKLNE